MLFISVNQISDENSISEREFRQHFLSADELNVTQRFGYDVLGCIFIEHKYSIWFRILVKFCWKSQLQSRVSYKNTVTYPHTRNQNSDSVVESWYISNKNAQFQLEIWFINRREREKNSILAQPQDSVWIRVRK